jgi:hypothetical protein
MSTSTTPATPTAPTTPTAPATIFYEPIRPEKDGDKGPCSVCGKETTDRYNPFSSVIVCNGPCKMRYDGQWTQCGLSPDSSTFMFKGIPLWYVSDRLQKNTSGEVCIVAYDLREEDEYISGPKILLPIDVVRKANKL